MGTEPECNRWRVADLKVMIVASWAQRGGGAEQMLWTYLSEVSENDVQVTVVFLEDGPLREAVDALGHRTHTVRAGRLRQPGMVGATIRRLRRLMRIERPDTVVAWSAKAHVYVGPAAVLAGMSGRVVWWQHMIPAGAWIDRLATALPARAVGCSSAAGAAAQRRLGRTPSFVVHPGVASEVLACSQTIGARVAARKALDFSPDTFVVAIVGRLDRWKRQDAVIDAIYELRAAGRNVMGLVIGGDAFELTGEYSSELREQVAELGLQSFVRFTGQVDDVPALLAAADVLVNASEAEPFGIVLIEAMALGVPVIAVARGGPTEIVDDGSTGFLLADGHPSTIAGAIARLADDPAAVSEMGGRARDAAHSRFSPTAMAQRMTAALRPDRQVTIVIQDVGPVGGMERHAWEVVTGLLERGWKVSVVAFTCSLPEHERLRFIRVRGPRRPFPLAYPWFMVASAVIVSLRGRGVIHSHGAVLGSSQDASTIHFCHQAFAATGVARRARRNGLAFEASARLAQALKVVGERWVYRPGNTRALVAISRGVEVEARTWLSRPTDQVVRIPHGVDHERFRPSAEDRGLIREELSIDKDTLVLLFVGGEWDRKGLRAAIHAVGAVSGWTLLVAGDGDRPRFSSMAHAACADVRFLGRRSDAPALFAAADAFILPSTYETFSLATHEAAAAGLPLLCGRTHGIDELLADGVNGWFVTADETTIAAHLDTLRKNPGLRGQLGKAAREASQPYTWTRTVEAHEALYTELASAAKGRGRRRRHIRRW